MNDSETMWGSQTLGNNAISTVPIPTPKAGVAGKSCKKGNGKGHWREGLNRVQEKEPGRGTYPQLSGRQVF